jgi:hypothetical protein
MMMITGDYDFFTRAINSIIPACKKHATKMLLCPGVLVHRTHLPEFKIPVLSKLFHLFSWGP